MTMWSRHVDGALAPYADGALTPRAAQRVALHLAHCARCRAGLEQVRFGMAMVEQLPSIGAPDAIWQAIESRLGDRRPAGIPVMRSWRLALAATVMLAIAGAAAWRVAHPSGARWDVQRIEGRVAVGGHALASAGQVGSGEWIETDAGSRAAVAIGGIGSVDVAPNTRVRVVTTRPDDNRLALDRGEIHATISAPPKLFFVETASGTAVDLGCEYSLKTDEDGSGLLRVTRGWVSFQWQRLESLVPAGASCVTRPHLGPGIPYFDDASDAMKRELSTFGLEKVDGDAALDVILAEARVRDTLALWHLLSRADVSQRGRIYDRIAALTPVPAGVSRDQALALDPATLTLWREELAWTW